jgi:hypothetical protein
MRGPQRRVRWRGAASAAGHLMVTALMHVVGKTMTACMLQVSLGKEIEKRLIEKSNKKRFSMR